MIPGLSHGGPVVWGDTIFVTSAVSQDSNATFKPGLYGAGAASADRSVHKWMLYAIDRVSGRTTCSRWENRPHVALRTPHYALHVTPVPPIPQ